MSGTLNKVMLIGHLGDDVKLHYFKPDSCIGRFSLATNDTYTNKETGEKTTNTEWHNIVVRNKAAEICEKYLSKGDKVYIEGKIRSRQWTTDEGITKFTTEIQCVDFSFLSTKKNPNSNSNPNHSDAKNLTFETNKTELPQNDLPF